MATNFLKIINIINIRGDVNDFEKSVAIFRCVDKFRVWVKADGKPRPLNYIPKVPIFIFLYKWHV